MFYIKNGISKVIDMYFSIGVSRVLDMYIIDGVSRSIDVFQELQIVYSNGASRVIDDCVYQQWCFKIYKCMYQQWFSQNHRCISAKLSGD